LGEGGFGAVFLARNHLDKNLNAVKKVRLNMADMNSRKVKL
jgi:serine/threonine protein kinase